MIVLNLQAKNCMSHLLLKSTFDNFSLIEGEVTTYNTFRADGYIHKDFFEDAPQEEYSSWSDLREFFFHLIRGKRTPLKFKFILSLPEKHFEDFLSQHEISEIHSSDIRGLYLNFKYDGTTLQCVTGTSLNIFILDKTLENAWDEYVRKYFLEQDILFE